MKHCPSGHPYTPENRYRKLYNGKIQTHCRPCLREKERQRRKEAVAARPKAKVRTLPPPAKQPENPLAISGAELRAEMAASRERREKQFEAALATVRATYTTWEPGRHVTECATCFKEFVYTGRKPRTCQRCRGAKANRPEPREIDVRMAIPRARRTPEQEREIKSERNRHYREKNAAKVAEGRRLYRERTREKRREDARRRYAALTPEQRQRRNEMRMARYYAKRGPSEAAA